MTRSKAFVGVLLLCALVFSALGAANASAKKGFKTFTCAFVFSGGEFGGGHCNKKGTAWAHVVFNKNTTITAVNKRTKGEEETSEEEETVQAELSGAISGVEVKIDAKEVAGSGNAENKEVEGVWEGTGSETLEYKELTVTKPSGCTVKAPITLKATRTTKVISESPEEMGLEYKPLEGESFGSFTLEGKECPLNGTSLKVSGTFVATAGGTPNGSGGLFQVTPAMTKSTLKLGGNAAELQQRITLRGENGNPLVYTTVP